MHSRTSPSTRHFVAEAASLPRKIRLLMNWGSRKNRPTDSATASITARPITTFSTDLPSFSDSHFSNFVGSSSMGSPMSSADLVRVFMPMVRLSTKATTPRTMGRP